jgi:hyaluronoglucosaminidase
MSQRGLNTFAYAPKDDPRLRADWRTPYSGDDLARLAELVGHAQRQQVDFLFCVSPGLSIEYSSAGDRRALVAKFQSVAELGVTFFGLLLDDIPLPLQHGSDRRAFADLAEAHIALIRDVYANLGPTNRLIVCPTVYWGRGDEDYVCRLGAAVDPRVDLFWTGTAVCSPTLDLLDAATFTRSANRPPTYWDNYPVNDVAMSDELHIGPYRGRDPQLYRFANGVIANGMELYECSKIAFATIADYLRDPGGYEPEQSWRRAIAGLLGGDDAEDFSLFADNVRSSALAVDDAPIVTEAVMRFMFQGEHGGGPVAASADLAQLADRLLAAADHLLRGKVRNSALIAEARPWIETFETGAQALRCLAQLAADDRPRSEWAAELAPYRTSLRDARLRVFGDTLDMTLTELTRQ